MSQHGPAAGEFGSETLSGAGLNKSDLKP